MDTVEVVLWGVLAVAVGGLVYVQGMMAEAKRADRKRQEEHEFEMAVMHEARKRRGYGGAK